MEKIDWSELTMDKSKDLIEYLNCILIDEDNNQAIVTRDWSGDLVSDGIQRGVETFHYENITYSDPYIKPITKKFNEEDELMILGKARGSDQCMM